MRVALLVLSGLTILPAQELPPWWKALATLPRLESRFVQESQSAVFGTLRKEGRLQFTRGGKVRIAYTDGLSLVSDGKTLVQYDPAARTAQRLDLQTSMAEAPMLQILMDPRAVGRVYVVRSGPGGSVLLEPRRDGAPKVELEGKGGLLKTIRWTDATGAKQTLELLDPKIPASIPESTYKPRVPEGTRWLEGGIPR